MASQTIDFKTLQLAYYNGSSLSKIVINGVRVWEKVVTQETYTVSTPYTRTVDGPRVKTGAKKKGNGASWFMPLVTNKVPIPSIYYHPLVKRYIYISAGGWKSPDACIQADQCGIDYYETVASQVQETYYVNETRTRDVVSYVYGP